MNRIALASILLIPVLMLSVTPRGVTAQCSYQPGGSTNPGAAVEQAMPVCFYFVYQEFMSPLEDIDNNMDLFMNRFFATGLQELLRPYVTNAGAPPMAYFPRPPQPGPDRVATYRIGFPVEEMPSGVPSPLEVEMVEFPLAARLLHMGPYEEIFEVYPALTEHAGAAGYGMAGPTVLVYRNDPSVVSDPAEFMTEIMAPLSTGAEPQACCLNTGYCIDVPPEECGAAGTVAGTPQGPGTTCDDPDVDCSYCPEGSYPEMDFNFDCWVNLIDFGMFVHHWLDCTMLPPEACMP